MFSLIHEPHQTASVLPFENGMSVVVPRWEWRTFGDRFPDVEALIAAASPGVRASWETYIVGHGSNVNVKIRDGTIDVKVLKRVDRGLELWSPVLKAPFPIGLDAIVPLFSHWQLPVPTLMHSRYSHDEFLNELVALIPRLRVVGVEKRRRATTVLGCTVELAALMVGGRAMTTAR